jgi:hypothetical protein
MNHIPLDRVTAVRFDGEWWPVAPGTLTHLNDMFGPITYEFREANSRYRVLVRADMIRAYRLDTDASGKTVT